MEVYLFLAFTYVNLLFKNGKLICPDSFNVTIGTFTKLLRTQKTIFRVASEQCLTIKECKHLFTTKQTILKQV